MEFARLTLLKWKTITNYGSELEVEEAKRKVRELLRRPERRMKWKADLECERVEMNRQKARRSVKLIGRGHCCLPALQLIVVIVVAGTQSRSSVWFCPSCSYFKK